MTTKVRFETEETARPAPRYRVGLLVPDSNTVTGPDLAKGLADIADVTTEFMHLPDPVTAEGELQMLREFAVPAACKLADNAPDLVVFGCSSATALLGISESRTLMNALSEAAHAPVVGVNPCLYRALGQTRAENLMVISPYEDGLAEAVVNQLRSAGVPIWASANMRVASNREVGAISPRQIVDFVCDEFVVGCDAILIACGNLQGFAAEPGVRSKVGVPTLSTNSATESVVRWLLTQPDVRVAIGALSEDHVAMR